MLARTDYPVGVPCWVDLVQPDFHRTMDFYGDLFGWDFQVRTPEDAPVRYAYAMIDGLMVGGVGSPPPGDASTGWTSYVRVDSADETAAAVEAHGGRVLAPPMDVGSPEQGHAGRVATFADPEGAVFGAWQPAENRGAQLVNAPGAWSFSELHTADTPTAERFYGNVLGWAREPLDYGRGETSGFWRLPGYGEFLAAHDPEIRERQESDDQAPAGFADAVALVLGLAPGESAGARWTVTFGVADADAAFARAIELGADVVTPLVDTAYTRQGTVRDPQGAELTLGEYRPPTG